MELLPLNKKHLPGGNFNIRKRQEDLLEFISDFLTEVTFVLLSCCLCGEIFWMFDWGIITGHKSFCFNFNQTFSSVCVRAHVCI